MFASKLFLAAAAMAVVNAQTTTDTAGSLPTAGISTCVLTCVGEAVVSAGCSSLSDTTCVCGNQDFLSSATTCLTSNCTAEEQQEALALQSQVCGASSSGSGSGTASGSASTSDSSSSSVSQSLPTGSSTVTSGSSTATSPSGSSSTRTPLSSGTSGSSGAPSPSGSDGGDGALAVPITSLGGLLAAGMAIVGMVIGSSTLF